MKKLIKLIIPICTVLLFSTCFLDDDFNGSGIIESETRTLDDFQNIDIAGVIKVNISFGTTQSVTVTADDNIINKVNTEVTQNTLFIDLDKGDYHDITVIINVVIPQLNKLTNSGVTTSTVSNFDNIDILEVNNSGVGSLDLDGSARKLILHSSGVGTLNGFSFVVDTCQINHSGVGNVRITVNDLLSGTLSGVGNIYCKGDPKIEVTQTGVGNIINSN